MVIDQPAPDGGLTYLLIDALRVRMAGLEAIYGAEYSTVQMRGHAAQLVYDVLIRPLGAADEALAVALRTAELPLAVLALDHASTTVWMEYLLRGAARRLDNVTPERDQ